MLISGTPSKPAGRAAGSISARLGMSPRSSATSRRADLVALVEVSQLTWIGGGAALVDGGPDARLQLVVLGQVGANGDARGLGEGLRHALVERLRPDAAPGADNELGGLVLGEGRLAPDPGRADGSTAERCGLQQPPAADDQAGFFAFSRCPPLLFCQSGKSKRWADDQPTTTASARLVPTAAGRVVVEELQTCVAQRRHLDLVKDAVALEDGLGDDRTGSSRRRSHSVPGVVSFSARSAAATAAPSTMSATASSSTEPIRTMQRSPCAANDGRIEKVGEHRESPRRSDWREAIRLSRRRRIAAPCPRASPSPRRT